jgi:hypothetical protein
MAAAPGSTRPTERRTAAAQRSYRSRRKAQQLAAREAMVAQLPLDEVAD